jgi:DNA-directed RNA polymerase specialized sigma24 family protein
VQTDRVPSTHATWIDAQLTIAEGGDRAAHGGDAAGTSRANAARNAIRRHVMERYTPALSAYAAAGGLRRTGERDELVSGFYAGPMADPAFFARWRRSGLPLRRWLMNAMSFHCRGLRRDQARERERIQGTADPAAWADAMDTRGAIDQDAAAAFDRAWALALVNEAYARVQADLADTGRGGEDEILRMHVVDGMPYEEIARALGLTRNDCFNATRRVAARVREAMRELLRDEGVPESGMDAAVTEVLRLVDGG